MDIAAMRKRLDALDARLVSLLRRRMELSLRIARQKAALGLPQRDLAREADIRARAAALAKAPLPPAAARAVLVEVLRQTRAAAKAALKNRGKYGS